MRLFQKQPKEPTKNDHKNIERREEMSKHNNEIIAFANKNGWLCIGREDTEDEKWERFLTPTGAIVSVSIDEDGISVQNEVFNIG